MQQESQFVGRLNVSTLLLWEIAVFFAFTGLSAVEGFVSISRHHASPQVTFKDMCLQSAILFATKKKKKKRPGGSSSSGFGGAAMESCPCGSGETYASCCGKLHRDVNSYRMATPEQVVRARYSAYAKKQPEFLMASTHPLNKSFDTDLKRWKESIK